MPPWGRPSGDAGSVRKYMEEAEDPYKFLEVGSDDEKNGVLLDSGFRRDPSGKQPANPDELYFTDMDIRAWEQRTGDADGMAYGDDYGDLEDEGYYDDAGDITMSATEFEELLFQRVLDKIRVARATGDSDVQLLPEELEAYQARIWRSRTPAAHPQTRSRLSPAIAANSGASTGAVASASNASTSGKKKQRRTSLFGSKSKEKKSTGRSRAPSTVSEMPNQPPPPGFVVPGPNGQPMFAPISSYQGRTAPPRPTDSTRSSRSASTSSDMLPPAKAGIAAQARGLGLRLPQVPVRISPSSEMPGTFPGSPVSFVASPAQSPALNRPSSSSSRQSGHDSHQAPKLVPFPTMEYKHHSAEPYLYQAAGTLASSSSSSVASQPQYSRRVASGDAYAAVPRRVPVPVPVQRANASQSIHGSYSDPLLSQRSVKGELSEEEEEKPRRKGSGGGERKRKGKSRRKN